MIAREVGEDGGIVDDRALLPESERVRRNFHDDVLRACLRHVFEEREEVEGIGRREFGRNDGALKARPKRADEPRSFFRRLQDVKEEVCRRRLAVGPRDGDKPEPSFGMPAKRRRDARHRLARVGYDELRRGKGQFVLGDKSRGAPFQRLFRKEMPVRMRARDAEEKIALPHGAAVGAQGKDVRIPHQPLL